MTRRYSWEAEAEAAFAAIMGASGLERLAAIRLYRRFGGDLTKALKYASSCGVSVAQKVAYEETKAKRLAGLAQARIRRAQNRVFQQRSRA